MTTTRNSFTVKHIHSETVAVALCFQLNTMVMHASGIKSPLFLQKCGVMVIGQPREVSLFIGTIHSVLQNFRNQ